MAIQKVDGSAVTTHLLVNRKSACGNPKGEPAGWPIGNHWVRREMGYIVTCPVCQRLLKEINAERKGS